MTTATRTGELDERIANLVQRGQALAAQIAPLAADLDDIKSELRRLLAPGTWQVAGRDAVTVKTSGQWSPEQARTVLTPEQLALCTVPVIDAKLAKAVLPPAVYAACQRPKAPSVEFKTGDQ